jgi:hypothetical protein
MRVCANISRTVDMYVRGCSEETEVDEWVGALIGELMNERGILA